MVAPERRDMGQKEMRDEHGLSRPEMRERRHQGIGGGRGLPCQRGNDASESLLKERDAPPEVEAQIHRDLLVARPARVEAAAGVAEPLHEEPLDKTVHVFVRAVDERLVRPATRENVGERGLDLPGLIAGEDAGARQRPRPRKTSGDIVFEQAAIEAERGAPFKGRRIGCGLEAPGPESRHRSTSEPFRGSGAFREESSTGRP